MIEGTVTDIDDKALLLYLRTCVENHLGLSENISFAFEAESFLNGDMATDQTQSDIARMEELEDDYIKNEDFFRKEVIKRGLKELPPRKNRHSDYDDSW